MSHIWINRKDIPRRSIAVFLCILLVGICFCWIINVINYLWKDLTMFKLSMNEVNISFTLEELIDLIDCLDLLGGLWCKIIRLWLTLGFIILVFLSWGTWFIIPPIYRRIALADNGGTKFMWFWITILFGTIPTFIAISTLGYILFTL